MVLRIKQSLNRTQNIKIVLDKNSMVYTLHMRRRKDLQHAPQSMYAKNMHFNIMSINMI